MYKTLPVSIAGLVWGLGQFTASSLTVIVHHQTYYGKIRILIHTMRVTVTLPILFWEV
jgi:hypothetical protein